MNVAVVTVGDELLAGRTTDTNATWLCERLADRGATVERVTTVPDRIAAIARVVNEYRAEYDAVIVTGGLGPTHDDVTMAGIAAALGRSLEEHEEALAWLEEDGYSRAELTEGTAALPEGARACTMTLASHRAQRSRACTSFLVFRRRCGRCSSRSNRSFRGRRLIWWKSSLTNPKVHYSTVLQRFRTGSMSLSGAIPASLFDSRSKAPTRR